MKKRRRSASQGRGLAKPEDRMGWTPNSARELARCDDAKQSNSSSVCKAGVELGKASCSSGTILVARAGLTSCDGHTLHLRAQHDQIRVTKYPSVVTRASETCCQTKCNVQLGREFRWRVVQGQECRDSSPDRPTAPDQQTHICTVIIFESASRSGRVQQSMQSYDCARRRPVFRVDLAHMRTGQRRPVC